jgi:polysaccharide biosynthesis PFTS motif protein
MIKSIFNKLKQVMIFGFNYEEKIILAHNILIKNKTNNKVHLIKEKICNLGYLNSKENFKYDKKFKYDGININLSLEQFFYNFFINNQTFNSKLIFSLAFGKKFSYSVPKQYLKLLNDNNVKTQNFLSKISWFVTNLILLTYNILSIIFQSFYLLKISPKKKKVIYLDALSNVIPNDRIETDQSDFYSWCFKFLNINSNVTFVHSNILLKKYKISASIKTTHKILYSKFFYLKFSSLKFFTRYFKAFFETIIFLFKNIKNLKFTILSKEIFIYFYLKKCEHIVPDYSFFNNSKIIYKPLWTYLNKNDDYLFYYSTNIYPINSINDSDLIDVYGHKMYTWSKYIVWYEGQKKWLNKKIPFDFNVFIGNFIPYEGKNINLGNYANKKKLVIFDVTPRNKLTYSKEMNPYNIYSLDYCKKFLKDIFDIIEKKNISVVLKRKRQIKTADQEYENYISSLKISNNKINIHYGDTSAQSLIKKADICISIPLTSTALIANYFNKPTAYYDPLQLVADSVYFPNNIKILKNKEDLKVWINKFLN